MKKLLLFISSLLLIFSMASCGNSKPEIADYIDSFSKVKEEEINGEVIALPNTTINNMLKNEAYAEIILMGDSANKVKAFRNLETDVLSFYSVLTDKLIDTKGNYTYSDYYNGDLHLDFYTNNLGGFLVVFQNDNYSVIADANGVLTSSHDMINIISCKGVEENELVIAYTVGNFATSKKLRVKYESLTNRTVIEELDSYEPNNNYSYEYELDSYGLEDYKLVYLDNKSLVAILDENNKIKVTYILPSILNATNTTKIMIKEGYLIQEKVELPEDATDYAYSENGVKFNLHSYTFNFLKGELKEINLDYIINSGDLSNDYKYVSANVVKIRDDKTLEEATNVLLNNNLKIVLELGDFSFSNIIKLKSGYYYSVSNSLLFDEEFKLVNNFSSYEVTYLDKYDVFIVYNNNYSTIFSSKGMQLAPFSKGNLYYDSTYDNAYIIRNNDNEFDILEVKDDNLEKLSTIKLNPLNAIYESYLSSVSSYVKVSYDSSNLKIYVDVISSFSKDKVLSYTLNLADDVSYYNVDVKYQIYTGLNENIYVFEVDYGTNSIFFRINLAKNVIEIEK